MRLPVVGNISTKDGASNKNARMVNVLAEEKQDKTIAAVRPGLNQLATGSGDGNNLVCFNGDLVNIYGNTVYQVVPSGAGIYSEDLGAIGASNISYRISFGNNLYVAAPSGPVSTPYKFYSSTDGINWSLIDITYTYSSRVPWMANIWNGSQFLIISDLDDHDEDGGDVTPTVNYYAKSTDGASWDFGIATGLEDFDPSNLDNIAWNGSLYCLITTSAQVGVSSNGTSWTKHAAPVTLGAIASNGSIFCAMTAVSSATCYTSSNGSSWTARTMPTSAFWFSVIYANGKFFAAASSGATAYSADGITWSSGGSLAAASWFLAHDGTYLVAVKVAAGSTTIALSDDSGVSWDTKTLGNSGYWFNPRSGDGAIILSEFAGTATDKLVFAADNYDLTNIGTMTDGFFDFALIP